MDCVTREKPCLRRCHGITHKQRRTLTELPIASLYSLSPHPSADTENTRKMVSRDQLCGKPHNSPPDSHVRPERHAHCRVRDDGVPVLHVEPIPARLRQLRVVVQELEQDDDEVATLTPGSPALLTRARQKRKFGQKGLPDKRKKKER